MIDLEEKKPTALLVGLPDSDLTELKSLADTLGFETLRQEKLVRVEQNPVYGIGSGKAKELSDLAENLSADAIIFDFLIEPRKQRNWEKLCKRPVFDRQEVILRIFADRAKTREAKLQVALARLEYSLPRLAHSYGDMARQRGGAFGSKGSGETQLELDSRRVREKIAAIKKELALVESERETQRKKREKNAIPLVALAGYTNAGKSSLLNALTNAQVFVEDKLFATLDPTTRKLSLPNGNAVLLTDTVGFVSNLPHTLVNAFKSTLEEAKRANLLLIVLDASDSAALFHYETVEKVLSEIGAENSKKIVVLNKIDKIPEGDLNLSALESRFPKAVKLSAKSKFGFDELFEKIAENIYGILKDYVIPIENHYILTNLRKIGAIEKEEWLETEIRAKIRADENLSKELAQYQKESVC